MYKLDDEEIRRVLINRLAGYKNTYLTQEFTTYSGKSRADVIAINGHINAFEIKSDFDSLDRLPGQISEYNLSFEKNTIVTSYKYIDEVKKVIPKFWGIIYVEKNVRSGKIHLHFIRRSLLNPKLNFISFVGLENSEKLKKIIINNGFYKKGQIKRSEVNKLFKFDLISTLDNNLTKNDKKELISLVRESLKKGLIVRN